MNSLADNARGRIGRSVGCRRDNFPAGMEIGEIAATAARDKNFFADTTIVLQHKHSSTAQTGCSRTHQACATRANDNGVELLNGLIRRLAHAVRGLVHVKQFIRIE